MGRKNRLDTDLYADLYEVVERCTDEDDLQFTTRVKSLLAAYQWGRDIGVQYHWVADKDEDGDDVAHCCAFYQGRFVGINTGWLPGTADDPAYCAWAQGEICWELFSDFPFAHGTRMYADLGGVYDLGDVRPAELETRIVEIIAAVKPELDHMQPKLAQPN